MNGKWRWWAGLLLATTAWAQTTGPVVGFKKWTLATGEQTLDGRVAAFAMEAGTVTGVANSRLLAAASLWETNRWANHHLLIASGPGAGLLYAIHGNTAGQLSVEPDPLLAGVVLVGAQFEILANLEEDFGAQLAPGDRVGVAPGETNGAWFVRKDDTGQWRDDVNNPATLPLLPGQKYRLNPRAQRSLVISGRVLWTTPHENSAP